MALVLIWNWAKKYWMLLAGILVALLGFMFGVSVKKAPVIVTGVDPEQKKAEDETAKKEANLQQQAVEQKKVIETQHESDVQIVIAAEQKQEPVLEKNTDETNDFLKQVGAQVQEPPKNP